MRTAKAVGIAWSAMVIAGVSARGQEDPAQTVKPVAPLLAGGP